MKILLAILPLFLSNPALGQSFVSKVRRQQTECRGSVQGTVFAQDGKPWGQINLILKPVGDYDYVLPRTKTDEHGQYRFSDVSWGGWSVFVLGLGGGLSELRPAHQLVPIQQESTNRNYE